MPEQAPSPDAPFDKQVEYAKRHLLEYVANRAWVCDPTTLPTSVPIVWAQMWSAKLAEDTAALSQQAVERSTQALDRGVEVQRAGNTAQWASTVVVLLSVILSAVSLLLSSHVL